MATIKTKAILLKELLALKEVIDEGSIQTAGVKNGIKTSNMSKLISDLESRLGTQLITRTTSGSLPTNSTQILYSDIEKITTIIDNVVDKFINMEELSGFISVWTEEGLIGSFILRDLSLFYAQYPKIRLELLTHKDPDIKNTDILIIDKSIRPNIHGTTLFKFKVKAQFFTTDKYLQTHGNPKNLDDLLENYDLCLTQRYLNTPECEHIMKHAKHLNTTSDSIIMISSLVLANDGVTLLPSWFSKLGKHIVPLPTIDFSYEYEAHCICRPELAENKKIRAFVKFFADFCAKNKVSLEMCC